MATDEDRLPDYKTQKKKPTSDEDKRKKKIVPGSLMKAVIRPGGGEVTPTDGDQVIYHCTIRTLDGVVIQSTRREFGGNGAPIRHVLGKSKMILGLLEGIPTMLTGEVAMFKMKPEMHYGEEDCPVSVDDRFPKDSELHFEIELIDFSKVKVISEDLGVLKKVIDEGQGWETPREPYEVKAWISARSGEGKMVLSRAKQPVHFTLGKSEIPKGLEMGIGTMSRGEKAVIYVTGQHITETPLISALGGVEEIYFEVELVHFVQVRDVLGDGRLIKRRIRDGRGEFPMDCPLHDSLLRVHYKGILLNGAKTVFYDTKVDNHGQPLEFSSGEGLVPEGFEMCVRLMLPGELALVTCPPEYAYDKFQRPANVPEGAHIQWEIELLEFEMPKDWTGFNFRQIMEDVEKIKGTGNRLFKEGKYQLAKAKYEKACVVLGSFWQVLREFKHVNPQDDDEGKEFSDTRNLLHLNVAACFLKMGDCRKSIEECNKVLDANPIHVKALYRRGMAYMTAGDFEEARNDLNKMMSIDKSSEPTAKAALLKLKKEEQEVHRRASYQFKGLFDKNPGEISEAGVGEREEIATENNNDEHHHDLVNNNEQDIEQVAAPTRLSFMLGLLPKVKRLFTAVGLNRCTIL
ncbi:peptidyl-prolyl cis-trans isomerase PASTICCINO1 isoform X1 [Coffea eugenioides]|uniref:peptidyl-prolyl cis-trans isomerase PASTICCINO1 isoform X1 n=1 Tax=Coffea eugenioides TaxID=49369 RepID=UPI000F606DE6|nr:peptidyl-prolyl cis-trans isomerase PASTICCINO1 isoform X1 [Coffea eugenioides]